MRNFVSKADDREIAEVCNFIHDVFKLKTINQGFVHFDDEWRYVKVSKVVRDDEMPVKIRCPDITVLKDGKPLCFIEIDGSIHDYHVWETEARNSIYRDAGLDLIVANKSELELDRRTVIDFVHAELEKRDIR